MQLTDFAKDGIDIAIRYGPGRYPDLVSEKLLDETVTPVGSPALLQSLGNAALGRGSRKFRASP